MGRSETESCCLIGSVVLALVLARSRGVESRRGGSRGEGVSEGEDEEEEREIGTVRYKIGRLIVRFSIPAAQDCCLEGQRRVAQISEYVSFAFCRQARPRRLLASNVFDFLQYGSATVVLLSETNPPARSFSLPGNLFARAARIQISPRPPRLQAAVRN